MSAGEQLRLTRAAAAIRLQAEAAARMSASPTIHAADAYARQADALHAHADRLQAQARRASS